MRHSIQIWFHLSIAKNESNDKVNNVLMKSYEPEYDSYDQVKFP